MSSAQYTMEGTRTVVWGMKRQCKYKIHAQCMCDDRVVVELCGGSSRQRGRSVRVRDTAYMQQHSDDIRQVGGQQ